MVTTAGTWTDVRQAAIGRCGRPKYPSDAATRRQFLSGTQLRRAKWCGVFLIAVALAACIPPAVAAESASECDGHAVRATDARASDASADAAVATGRTYRHAIVTDLTLPLFGAFALDYNYRISERFEAVIGFWYSKTSRTGSIVGSVPYPGTVESIAGVVGARAYLWRGFHLEYQLLPGLSRYRKGDSEVPVDGFTLFNEFRIGYNFDTFLLGVPIRVNLQFPLGFELTSTNKPEGFQAADDEDPWFFIFIPNPYIGVRF